MVMCLRYTYLAVCPARALNLSCHCCCRYTQPDRLQVFSPNGTVIYDSGNAGVAYLACTGLNTELPINSLACQGLSGALRAERCPDVEPVRIQIDATDYETYFFFMQSPCPPAAWEVQFDCDTLSGVPSTPLQLCMSILPVVLDGKSCHSCVIYLEKACAHDVRLLSCRVPVPIFNSQRQ